MVLVYQVVRGGYNSGADRFVLCFGCGGWFKELKNSHASFTTNEIAHFMIPF